MAKVIGIDLGTTNSFFLLMKVAKQPLLKNKNVHVQRHT